MSGASARPRVKLCGIQTCDAARAAVAAGADMVGLVLVPGARRHVDPRAARDIARAVRHEQPGALLVGVVDGGRAGSIDQARAAQLDAVQIAGSADDVGALVAAAGDLLVLRAIAVADVADAAVEAALWEARGAQVLFDAHGPGRLGGTGRMLDVDLVAPLFAAPGRGLAGGLTPETVGGMVRRLGPALVDVSSGIERAGTKDPLAMRRFVVAARAMGGVA